MDPKESRYKAIEDGALGGAGLGALGSAWLISEADSIPASPKLLFKTILGCTVIGAVAGAFYGAARPLKQDNAWVAQALEKSTNPFDAPPSHRAV